MDSTPKKKRKRKDVSDKLKARRHEEEFIIKTSLRGSLKGSRDEKDRLQHCFKDWSDAMSQRLVFASRGLTLMVKECFNKSKDFKTAQLPNFLDQTFIRQLMLCGEGSRIENSYIKDLFTQHPYLLKPTPRHKGDRNLYSSAARAFLTNILTSLSYIFEKRFLKLVFYTKKLMDWKEDETIAFIKHHILGDFLSKDILDMKLENKYPSLFNFIQSSKDFLGLEQSEIVTEQWLKANPYQVIRFYAYILSELSKDKELKLFNLLPLTDVKNHYATLDASCLLGVFKDVKILGEKAKEENITKELLDSVFKIPRNKAFTGTIQTDGTSICFHFRRPKKKVTKEQVDKHILQTKELFKEEKTRRLGCDPGRENIYTIIEEGTNKVWKLSRKEYYSVSGIYQGRERTEKWTRSILPNLNALSKVSSKGISLKSYLDYLKVFLENYETLWSVYSKKYWAEQRLRMYGGKKRCFDRFWNEVLGNEGERNQITVIAYGAGKFAPGGKGEISVPTSRAFKECKRQKGLKVLVVDEFRTSKLHHETEQLLHLVKVQGEKKSLRGLLWCCSTISEKQGFFVNRDVNAALNILKNCVDRKNIFTRKKDMKRLPKQEVKKIIKKERSSYKPRTLHDQKI